MWSETKDRAPTTSKDMYVVVRGGRKVYEKFLKWPRYLRFKNALEGGFLIWECTFLETRCECVT